MYPSSCSNKPTLKRKVGDLSLLDRYMVDSSRTIPPIARTTTSRLANLENSLESLRSSNPQELNSNEYNRAVTLYEGSIRHNEARLRTINKSVGIRVEQKRIANSLPSSVKNRLAIRDLAYKKEMDSLEALRNQNEGIRNATKLVNSRTGIGDLTNNPNTMYSDVSF